MIKQPVLAELQYFVNSVSLLYKGVPPKDTGALVKSSLHLLEDLPSTREAVFEYFTLVFNNAVKHYMNNVEKNIHDPSADDEAVQEIHEALERLVACGPPAWSPMISSWCLKLLGELCKKHGRRRPPDIRSSCNLWLGCTTIRYLVSLTALCLEKLTDAEVDGCIAELLTIYGSHSPSFDWVVARLGGCFPLKVISCMVTAGLKRFGGDYDQVSDSEVEILSYLGLAHENDLRYALKSTLEAEPMVVLTVPYLLLLAKSSDTISQALVAVFLDLYNEKRLESAKINPKHWPPSFNLSFVLHMVAGLLLKIRKNSTSVTLLLAKLAGKHGWCQELLEVLFVDLETLVLDKQTAPLLEDIFHEGSREALWKSSISDAPYQQQVAVRLILLASFKSNSIFHQSIVYLLSVNDGETASLTDKPHLNSLARLLGGPHGTSEVPKIRPAFETAIEKILLAPNARTVGWNILHNMVELLKLERVAPAGSLLKKSNCGGTLSELLDKVLQVWEKFMILERQEPRIAAEQGSRTHEHGRTGGGTAKRIKLEPDAEPMEIDDPMEVGGLINGADTSGTVGVPDLIHESVRLVECLDIAKPTAIGTAEALKLSQLLVKYFFFCLQLSNADAGASGHCAETSEELLQRVYLLLSRHCGNRKAARTAALRELLEGALFMHGELFGSQSEAEPYSFDKSGGLLIKLNQKQGIALNASRATVLHAGIIGQGPKVPSREAAGPGMAMQNRLLNAIVACCQDVNDHQATIDGFSYVSLLLVELISPDVMYNGLPWPEEEFTKVTMERDLQIRRTFRHSPILWSILGLIACYRPSLCYCSVLLRALCASALHQWRSKSAETLNGQKTDLMYVTTKLLELMALAQLLPPPLSYLHIVLEYFDGPEITYVLKECVWNYMKDHVPSPVLFVCDPTGFHWRDPLTSRPPLQYTNPLRNTMQKKLTKVGHLYYQMFVGPELRNPSPTVNPQSQQGSITATNAPSSSNGSEQGVHKTAGPHGPGLSLSAGTVPQPGPIVLVD
ncbi:integrator complex subunit 5 [Anopheles bellator]|uniref:integrator complex subunit 5 n=1 Tax=Anopheles bellator TaxID=139047 RepID=UPI002649FE9D|nr:integrator complex subunit 5 [Anopheles bellator]